MQIDCYGNTGSVILNTSSGTAPFTYGPEPTFNLTAGTYNYSVTDANGCTDNASATINPEPSPLSLSALATQILCFGGQGSVALFPVGGTPSYSFDATPTSGLAAGTYIYVVTDNNGCTANATAIINSEPAQLNANPSATTTPCGSSTGSVSVSVSGGVTPYSYSWNTIPVSNTASVNGLSVGTYTATVTDNNGCTTTADATVTSSNFPSLNITGITGICPGLSTTLCATSGFASYSWSSGETTQCISPSTADTFTVTVTDSYGCTGVKSVVTYNSTTPNCTITGGTLCPNSVLFLRAPLGYASYQWSNGTRTSYNAVRNAGTYSVTVSNSDNCVSTCSFTVNRPLRIFVTKSDAKCSNEFKGSASVTASDGIPPYSYSWSNGETTASITNLDPGYYTVRVTDSGGCVSVYTTTIYSNKTSYDYSTISGSFNSNAISPGTYIWFSAVVNVNYSGNDPATIQFTSQNINGGGINLIPANAKLIIDNAAPMATTNFINGEWVTTAPPNLSGDYFISGYAYPVMTALAPDLSPIRWRGIWTSNSSCVTSIQWKWSAATYFMLTTDNTLLGVKPVDDNSSSMFTNSDSAGTPEFYKANCIAGAMSAGGTDYTGQYTSSIKRLPCSASTTCNGVTRIGKFLSQPIESNFIMNAYPNPFSSIANIEFIRVEGESTVNIDIYSIYGEKVRTLFNDIVEAGVMYTVEFDAGDLADGLYIYRLSAGEDKAWGKLMLQKSK